MATPVVVKDSGGIAVTITTLGTPMTVITDELGPAVTLVDSGGLPVVLLNEDGTTYVPA